MQPLQIDPELSRQALLEAAQKHPDVAGRPLRVAARPLHRGYAWVVEWEGTPPAGQEAWEFQNTAIRAYKRLAGLPG
jgi:hypothetical protein